MRLASVLYNDFYPFGGMPCFTEGAVVKDPSELREGDALLVWGGADISPTLYRKAVSMYCHATAKPSYRDMVEWTCMQRARDMGLPIIGICRGAQMLCGLAGGYLLQDVNNHAGPSHVVTSNTGEEFVTNSAHHQMMYPYDVEHVMLASIIPTLGTYHYDVNDIVLMDEEPEAVYFPTVRGLAIQWHPEWLEADCQSTKWIFNQINREFVR